MVTKFFLWYDKQREPKRFLIYISSYLVGMWLIILAGDHPNSWKRLSIIALGFLILTLPPVVGTLYQKKKKKVDAVVQRLDGLPKDPWE